MAESVLAKLAVELVANNAKFTAALQQSQNQLNSFVGTATKVGAGLGIAFGGQQLISALSDAIGKISDFEKTMSEVSAITGATGSDFDALRKSALDLGAATKFTSQEVGQLQVAYGRLGFTSKEILNVTKATLSLSAATGEDLAKSADVAGSTLRAFGLDATETQRVVDVMAASFNRSALGLDNFSEAMKYVAPVAAAAGVSLEETTALLASLADNGIRGSSAGTALRKILGDLSRDGRPAQERIAELAKKGITLSDAFDEVGRTAQTALIVLTKNEAKTAELAKGFQNVAGEADKMAAIMQDNLAGDVEKLSSAWDGLILAFSEGSGALRDIAQGLTGLLNIFKDAVSSDAVGGFGKIFKAGVIDPLTSGFKTLAAFNKYLEESNKQVDFSAEAIRRTKQYAQDNGYTDLSKAVDAYKQSLYEALIAEQIRRDDFKKFNELSKGGFEDQIANSEAQISGYQKLIGALGDYGSALTKTAEAQVNLSKTAPVGLIQGMQESIKGLELDRSSATSADAIASLNDRIIDLRGELEVLLASSSRTTQFFKDLAAGVNTKITPKSDTGFNRQFNRDELPDFLPAVDGLTTVVDHIDKVNEAFAKGQESYKNYATGMRDEFQEAGTAVIGFSGLIGNAFSDLGEQIGRSIAGVQTFGEGIIRVVANFAKQFGEILIASGTAAIAAKLLIKNPYTAIAAGVALVAIAGAAGAAIKSSHQSAFGGGGSSDVSSGNVARGYTGQTVSVIASGELRVNGRDLVYIFNKNNDLDILRLGK